MIEKIVNGIPTGPDVRKLEEHIDTSKPCVVRHEQLERLIGHERTTSRYRTVVMAWRRKQFREKHIQMKAEPGVGYRVLDAKQALDQGMSRFSQSAKAMGRAYVGVAAINTTELSSTDAARHEHARRHMYMTVAAAQEARRIIASTPETKAHEPLPRRLSVVED